ncbi:MAG: ABC transporter substrate-binding protein [Acidimicrobiia bacterium]
MEPTNRRETGTRPSAMKRYGPFIAIVVVIAIVVAVVAIAGGGGDSSNKKADTNGQISTSGGPVTINDSNRNSIDWGPNCDVKRGTVKMPYTYAAPCVKPFKGNNGGATADGVTADSIKIVAYIGDPAKNPLQAASIKGAGADISPATAKETYKGYVDMFAKYYETYGRKIDLQFFDGTGGPMDEVAARADAKAIADMHPFAVLNGANQTPAWSDELAANHIMCLGNCSLAVPESFVSGHSPYIWSNAPTPEQGSQLTAALVTKLLKGKKAEFAGDALKNKQRVFGVVHYDTIDGQQTAAFAKLKSELTKGGVKIAADLPFLLDLSKAQENARTEIAKLKEAGVTSVIFTGDPLTPSSLTKEATAQNYFPEWIIGSNVLVDIALFGRTYDQEQWKHAFGLALTPDRTNQNARESYTLYQWEYGKPPPNNTYGVIFVDPATLFTGLQLAGPKLTPQTFADAMFRTPVAGGTPLSPTVSRGHHGLWPGTDWGGGDDTGILWWNPNAVGEDEVGTVGKGLYEYTAMGKRYTLDKMPTTDPGLFDPNTSITIFTTIPPQYAPPSYPSPAK